METLHRGGGKSKLLPIQCKNYQFYGCYPNWSVFPKSRQILEGIFIRVFFFASLSLLSSAGASCSNRLHIPLLQEIKAKPIGTRKTQEFPSSSRADPGTLCFKAIWQPSDSSDLICHCNVWIIYSCSRRSQSTRWQNILEEKNRNVFQLRSFDMW